MTRDELYDILRYISHATDSLELIWGQPFDGETEKINTTKSVSSTSPATEDSSVAGNSGNETDFVTKSMTADEIMAGKMAKDRVESDRWYAMFSEPFPTEEEQ